MPTLNELIKRQTEDLILKKESKYLKSSRQELERIRTDRLRAILTYAKDHSPWYQKKLATINIDTLCEHDLHELPILTKAELMANWDDIVTDRSLSLAQVEQHIRNLEQDEDNLFFRDQYIVIASGGSSGKRAVYIYDWQEWNMLCNYAGRYALYNENRTGLVHKDVTTCTVAVVAIANPVYGIYAAAKSVHFGANKPHHFPITLPLEHIVEGLNNVQADLLIGLPSTVYKLCQASRQGMLNIAPKAIIVGSEPLYEPIRTLIKQTWPKAALFNGFGSTEGLIGRNCHADSREMHLNDDGCIVEPVDIHGKPVGYDIKSKKLFVTNLYNKTLPLIRYEMNDEFLLLDKNCECGSTHQLIAEPEGRPDFDFTYAEQVFVHHLVFSTPILHQGNILEYQVTQTITGADIQIATIGPIDKEQLAKQIQSNLLAVGLNNPQVTITECPALPLLPSGKSRRFIPLAKSSL